MLIISFTLSYKNSTQKISEGMTANSGLIFWRWARNTETFFSYMYRFFRIDWFFEVAAETRDQKRIFSHNSVKIRARDKSNERAEWAGHYGGLVIEIWPKMTEILMVYLKKNSEKNYFFHFFWE